MRAVRFWLGLLLLASVLAPLGAAAEAPPGAHEGQSPATVESAVREQVETTGKVTVWIILRDRANLSRAYSIRDWADRGQYVYDQLTQTAEATQQELRAHLDQQGVPYESFWIMNALRVPDATQAVIDDLASQPDVEKIVAAQIFEVPDPIPGSTEATIQAVEWGISNIKAPQVWSDYSVRGEGIVVANIDTGVQYNHPALVNQYRGNLGGGSFDHNYNWADPSKVCGNPSVAPCDNNGHGTHTMGTMVGDDGASNQIGVAPGARWIAVKGCESNSCSDNALLEAGQWILAPTDLNEANPRPDLRPHIVNNSWGGGGGDTWYQAVVTAWNASGIFPMFSAGNSGPSCGTSGSPGDYLSAYGSGAYDINNVIAGFSSRGATSDSVEIKPNIAAPGVNIRSAVPSNAYASFNGTSMASPHVAGTIALMWSAAPLLVGDISTTRALLDDTAVDTENLQCGGTADDNKVFGEGRLDAFAAVTQSPRGDTGTLEGTVTDAATTDPIDGASVHVVGTVERNLVTAPDGTYGVTLPVGTYTVTVSKFGYVTQSFPSVEITVGATTTLDVALNAAPTYTVSGTVIDEFGVEQANATVSFDDAPIPPTTTNASGEYTFENVPQGIYDLTAQGGRCLSPQTLELTLNANADLDFTLPVRKDSFGYFCQIKTPAYVEGDTAVALTGDDVRASLALPFTFTFYGQAYTTVFVGTNGLLTFVDSGATNFSNAQIPATGTPNAGIYPFWDDMMVDGSSNVWSATLGSGPNRRFVIEWRNVRFFNASTLRVDFQVILHENGHILFQYRNVGTDLREQGNGASLGIENQTGTVGLRFSVNEAVVNDSLAVLFRADTLVANDDEADTTEDQSVSANVRENDSHPSGNDVSVIGLTQPANGSATLNADDTITYTPDADYNGSDSFTYKLTNGTYTSSLSTVTIDVAAINDAPSFAAGGNVGVGEDSGAYSAGWATSINAGPTDESGQVLSFQITGNSNSALFSAGPAIAANGTLSFTPALNVSGSANITVLLHDDGGEANGGQDDSAPVTFTITINAANDLPTIVVVGGSSCDAFTAGRVRVSLLVNDVETPAASLTTSAQSSNQRVVSNSTLSHSGSGANRTLTLTARLSSSGATSITVAVSDGQGQGTVVIFLLVGSNNPQTLNGTAGPDIIFGGSSVDTIDARAGNDLVCAGNGGDMVKGGDGDDTVDGAGGNDLAQGNAGNDNVRGGAGNDMLTGNTGADAFSGGSGTDFATDFSSGSGDTQDGSIP